jgi:NADH pyrophosphatase NudC (nudix superfamily)
VSPAGQWRRRAADESAVESGQWFSFLVDSGQNVAVEEHFYSSEHIDRTAVQRRDEAWVNEQLAAEGTLFVPVWRHKSFVDRAEALDDRIEIGDQELEDARWFTRPEIDAALATGELRLSPRISISRHLIERWRRAGQEELVAATT